MEFQLSCFKSWKMMLWKCCTQYVREFGKLSSGHRTGKGQFPFQSQRKAVPKNAQTITQLHSSHYTHKVMLKILQARLQQYMNNELPDVQACFRKGKGTRDQIANIHWIIEKSKRVPKRNLLLLYWLCQSLWLCGSQQTGKFFKRWEYQTTWSASWEICMQVRKQQLELDIKLVPNRERSTSRLYIVTLLI